MRICRSVKAGCHFNYAYFLQLLVKNKPGGFANKLVGEKKINTIFSQSTQKNGEKKQSEKTLKRNRWDK